MNRLLVAIFFFNCGFVSAAEIKVTINETFSNNVEVSGEFLKGIQMESINKKKSLHVYFPENSKGNLYIEISSIDGKYKADIKAEITDPVSGMVPIPFPDLSDYSDQLQEYSNNEIAILARIERKEEGQCSGNGMSMQLVSSWNSAVSKNLTLLIRSDARKDVAYFRNDDRPGEKCKKFRKSYNVSYDKYCVLENVNFDYFETIEIEIDRKNLQKVKPETVCIN